jgi:hypothetical protein
MPFNNGGSTSSKGYERCNKKNLCILMPSNCVEDNDAKEPTYLWVENCPFFWFGVVAIVGREDYFM